MKVRHYKPWMCFRCGYTMDSASSPFSKNAMPSDGDFSCCLNCGVLYRLHGEVWRPTTSDDMREAKYDEVMKIIKLQAAIKLGRNTYGDLAKKQGGRA